jgi:alanine dehydrogenase
MKIGVPKEIKESEYRVAAVPAGVHILTQAGHQVLVEAGAGQGSGIADEEYRAAGAELTASAREIYRRAELIVKVKEPLPEECELIREGQILFTYLHLAPAPDLTRALIDSKCVAVAYETIQLSDGSLPLLTPMSEVAGRLAPQVGAHYLEKVNGGRGVLLGGAPGVERGKVTIVGGGVAGNNAARIAVGLGAEGYILDINQRRLVYLDDVYGNTITTLMANPGNLARLVERSDLVIGAVLVPGAKAPALVTRDMVASMVPGSVIVDISIDQGGCIETSRPTSHQHPVFVVGGVIHYCVTNMPGIVARTSTFALTNVTLPYALAIAQKGIRDAVREDPALARGVNLYQGAITHPGVAEAAGAGYEDVLELLS